MDGNYGSKNQGEKLSHPLVVISPLHHQRDLDMGCHGGLITAKDFLDLAAMRNQ